MSNVPDSLDAVRERFDPFATYLCLLYHEARNVRHLVSAGERKGGRYRQLVSLPKNREAAWAKLQGLRLQASRAESATVACGVLTRRFHLTLDELLELFEDDAWRHSDCGGNRWAGITQSVIELRDALDSGNAAGASDLLKRIPTMSHNTGQVGVKLRNLDASLSTPT